MAATSTPAATCTPPAWSCTKCSPAPCPITGTPLWQWSCSTSSPSQRRPVPSTQTSRWAWSRSPKRLWRPTQTGAIPAQTPCWRIWTPFGRIPISTSATPTRGCWSGRSMRMSQLRSTPLSRSTRRPSNANGRSRRPSRRQRALPPVQQLRQGSEAHRPRR